MKIGRVVGAAALVGAGLLAYRALKKHQAEAEQASLTPPMPEVRDAGPENMSASQDRWSRTDQRLDESFPASDPPSTY